MGHDPVRKLSRHSVYEQVERRKLEHDSIRHGRFTIIAKQRKRAFINANARMLYRLYPFLAIQYMIL